MTIASLTVHHRLLVWGNSVGLQLLQGVDLEWDGRDDRLAPSDNSAE